MTLSLILWHTKRHPPNQENTSKPTERRKDEWFLLNRQFTEKDVNMVENLRKKDCST